jgi:hypothetical protein
MLSLIMVLVLFPFVTTPAVAAIDLQADLNRIIAGINKFDANSARSASTSTMRGVKSLFSNNNSILNEINLANSAFKRNLNSAKKYIPNKDTKDTPAFNTLMNLARGYEEWIKYQKINQSNAQKCINQSGNSFTTFSGSFAPNRIVRLNTDGSVDETFNQAFPNFANNTGKGANGTVNAILLL